MELKGIGMLLRWILRSSKRFGHRVFMLVDAKVALVAVAKGRSSAAAFRGALAHIAALQLASNTRRCLLYVPSEDNPADAPSRGRRRRPNKRRVLRPPGFSKTVRRLHAARRHAFRLETILAEDGLSSCGNSSS